jgi:hypothetical protein
MNKYPKLSQSIRENVVRPHSQQQTAGGYGIVMDYEPIRNTATVMMSSPASDQPGEVYREVMCPTMIGVQSVAPEIGRPCWVVFKNGSSTAPIITHFFNHAYDQIDYTKQNQATNSIPRYMTVM